MTISIDLTNVSLIGNGPRIDCQREPFFGIYVSIDRHTMKLI